MFESSASWSRLRRWSNLGLFAVLTLGACASTKPAPAPVVHARPIEALPFEPTPSMPNNVATAILMGSALLESGDVRGALRYYRFAHEALPDDAELGQRFVEVALQAGRAAEALEALEGLDAAHPQRPEFAQQRVRLLSMMGQEEAALELGQTLAERFPDDPGTLELRADLLQQVGQYAEALEIFETLLEEDSDLAVLHLRRGDLLAALMRTDEAEQEWRTAIDLDPMLDEAIDRLSNLLRGQDRADDLIEFLEQRIESDELATVQRARLADLYLSRGEHERTVELLLPLARRGELEPRAQVIVADLLASLGRQEEALATLVPLLEEPEPDGGVLRMVGELQMEMNQLDDAERTLKRAVEADPLDADAHVSLLLVMSQNYDGLLGGRASDEQQAMFEDWIDRTERVIRDDSVRQNFLVGAILRRQQNYERAQPLLKRAAKIDPDNRQALYDLAITQEALKDFDGARLTLDHLVSIDPDDVQLKNFYGYLLADQGWELDRAEAMIREAVDADPENGAYVDSLGWVLFRRGQHEAALELLIEAVNLIGDDPIILEHVGDCLRALGRFDRALRSYERALENGGDAERLQPRIEAAREEIREAP